MKFTFAIPVLVAVFASGVGILFSNPNRSVNRAVFAGCVQMVAWLICWHMAATSSDGLWWLRWTCSVGAVAPVNFWIVRRSILRETSSAGSLKYSSVAFLGILVPIVFVAIPFTEAFIPSSSTPQNRVYGWGYHFYLWGLVVVYLVIFQQTYRSLRKLTGVARLELQVWLGGGCALAGAVYSLMALSALTGDASYRRLQPIAMLVFYVSTAFFITHGRIFDARQILKAVAEFGVTVGVLVSIALASFALSSPILGGIGGVVFTVVLCLVVRRWFSGILGRWMHHYPREDLVRAELTAVARRQEKVSVLESSFASILRGWWQTEDVLLVVGSRDGFRLEGVTPEQEVILLDEIRSSEWVTPERLSRERDSFKKAVVRDFLARNRLSILVLEQGPSMNILVGLGYGASRRPFTFPQVRTLRDFAAIIESALERAHFSAKVQHTEQLATVGLLGASLAHEVRNPLVSIKTFVQLLPTHYQDPAFREKFFRLIGDEVDRIDQLTQQLLELAAPKSFSADWVDLHPVLRASVDLVSTKAFHRQIEIRTAFEANPDRAYTDLGAAKQVILNLCFNAIQALENHAGAERWVRIASRNVPAGLEISVEDSGPGIDPEIRPRLFQPFQTTKSKGFGLGLAICSDILANLGASIAVDPPEPGRGAVFRVVFPCQVPSS